MEKKEKKYVRERGMKILYIFLIVNLYEMRQQ